MPVQRRSIEDDQVVQTLTVNGADQPLDVRCTHAAAACCGVYRAFWILRGIFGSFKLKR